MIEQTNIPTVVILSRSDDNVKHAIQSIKHHDPACPIIVVDDGLHPMTYPTLDAWGVRRIVPFVRWIWDGEAGCWSRQPRLTDFVFARNANIGLRAAFETSEYAILMNDDCELQTDAGFIALANTASDFFIDLLSPSLNPAVLPQQQTGNCPIGSPLIRTSQLMFPCILVTKQAFDRIGPLDESLIHYGYDDNDYCDRARAAGLDLAVDHSVIVSHVGQSSYRSQPNWRTLMAANQLIYERKKEQTMLSAEVRSNG